MKSVASNMNENEGILCCGELREERVKETYWITFAFLVYKDIYKQEPLLVPQKAMSCLNKTDLDKYHENVY